jgi:glycosyltransferase involved in cell wall biosynthesis
MKKSNQIKIAIDSGPLTGGHSVRGVGVYARELLQALKSAKLKIEAVDLTNPSLFTPLRSPYTIFHLTSFKPFVVSLPTKKPVGAKFVLTIYDLIPLLYPKNYPPGLRGKINWLFNKYLIRKNIDAIITISETSKKDICRFLQVSPDKVHVVYLAPRLVFKKLKPGTWKSEIAKRYNLPPRFALYVGDINYNKNIPNLVKASKLAKTPLVIAGKQAVETEKMNLNHPELIHLKEVDWAGVIRLGFVPDEDLVKIYNMAAVYIQPSFYEGFGLPLVEAISSGTPSLSSRTQVLKEIAEGMTIFFDPHDPKSLSEKITLMLNDQNKRDALVKKGLETIKKFTWEKTASETLKIYEKI